MPFTDRLRGLHVISTGKQSLHEFAEITGEIRPFVSLFHLREKTKTARELIGGVQMMVSAGVPLEQILINDRADVAAAAQVQGVHLAYHSLDIRHVKAYCPRMCVGKSVHSANEARQAEADGADYVIFGHVFPTKSKDGLPAKGLKGLEQVVASVSIPVIAIGGIKLEHVRETLCAGAAGIAVMSGILEAEDPLAVAKAYYQLLRMGEGY